MRNCRVLIVGPSEADGGMSMMKYGELLSSCYKSFASNVDYKSAPFLFRRISSSKWFAYLDWWVVASVYFFIISRQYQVVHFVDHSKAYLTPFVRLSRQVFVTCHDVIAIRSAYDCKDIELTFLGKLMQKACLAGMGTADTVFCVSNTTKYEYEKYSSKGNSKVLFSSMNAKFEYTDSRLESLENASYVMHVGSNLQRKNRLGIVEAFSKSQFYKKGGVLVFCGAPVSKDVVDAIDKLDLRSSVYDIGEVSFASLEKLYSGAQCLVFPSFSEGFGWPILEAQACNTAVICSNRESMPEIAGEGAVLVDPSDLMDISKAIDRVTSDVLYRSFLIEKGKINVSKYSYAAMCDSLKGNVVYD